MWRRQFSSPNSPREADVASLYEVHREWLGAAVRRLGGNLAREDVVQEVFLRLARNPVRDVQNPKALLLQIARNVLRSNVRASTAAKRSAEGASVENDVERVGVAADQFEAILLKEIVLALPPIYREVFLLSRFNGMTYAEIAKVKGLSVQAVQWRMTRALEMCAAKLRE